VRLIEQLRKKFGPKTDQDENSSRLNFRDASSEQLKRTGIDPMRICEFNYHRPRKREAKNPSEQRGNREIPLSLWRQISQTAKSVCGDRQQGSEEWDIQCCCAGLRKQSFQFSKLYIGGVVSVQTSCMLKLIDYRVKWAVGVVRRALIPNSDVWLVGDAL
jgi:hypothetical protein